MAANQPEPSLADGAVCDLTTLVMDLSVVLDRQRGFCSVSEQGAFLQTLKRRVEDGRRLAEHHCYPQRGLSGTASNFSGQSAVCCSLVLSAPLSVPLKNFHPVRLEISLSLRPEVPSPLAVVSGVCS